MSRCRRGVKGGNFVQGFTGGTFSHCTITVQLIKTIVIEFVVATKLSIIIMVFLGKLVNCSFFFKDAQQLIKRRKFTNRLVFNLHNSDFYKFQIKSYQDVQKGWTGNIILRVSVFFRPASNLYPNVDVCLSPTELSSVMTIIILYKAEGPFTVVRQKHLDIMQKQKAKFWQWETFSIIGCW